MIRFNQSITLKQGSTFDNLECWHVSNKVDVLHNCMVIYYLIQGIKNEEKVNIIGFSGAVELKDDAFKEFYANWTSTSQLYEILLSKLWEMWDKKGIRFDCSLCVIDCSEELP